MKHKNNLWILVLLAGIIIEVLSILLISGTIDFPIIDDEQPLLIHGVVLAAGFVLCIKGIRMIKGEENDEEE